MTSGMLGRVISLTIYRAVIVSLTLIYQIFAELVGFPVMPFEWVLFAVALIGLETVCSLVYLNPERTHGNLSSLVFLQFFFDILVISILILLSGEAGSHLRFAYIITIVVSAIFLDRLSIYVIMVLSVGFYYLAIGFGPFLLSSDPSGIDAFGVERFSFLVGQTLLCMITALLSSFMQRAYRKARRDLDDQKKRIKSLQSIRKKIVESLPSGLIICDRDGGISFVNRMGQRILQVETDSLVGRSAWELFNLEPPGKARVENLSRVERRVMVKGGKRTFGISYRPMEMEEGGMGYMVVFQDLTKIKLLEAHRHLSEKMAAIGKVAAGVAHEIRNPLASISGSIQVIKELVPKDPLAVELAEIVARETRRLDDIISEFLAYARPSTPPSFEAIDLSRLLEEWMHLVENDAQMKDLVVALNLAPDSCIIMADEGKLKQVFWNLLRNAYQACKQQPRVEISCQARDEQVICTISDNGVGMDEEQLKDLFTPFLSFNKSGAGLGMSIVFDIIQVHQGRIDVSSKPGNGTLVTLTFARLEE